MGGPECAELSCSSLGGLRLRVLPPIRLRELEVLYWLNQSQRNLVLQSPRNDGVTRGTFALRSPVRPNPIGTSIVALIAVEESALIVRGLDCLDGTPLLDIKPDRTLFAPSDVQCNR